MDALGFKSGGGYEKIVRTCVDLRQVNMAIIPDKYPLLTAEKLTAEILWLYSVLQVGP